MDHKENQLAFRRIRGRIVPIKMKNAEDRKRRNFGIGVTALGGAIAAGGSRAERAMKAAAGSAESIAKKSIFSAKRIRERSFLFRPGPDLFNVARREHGAMKALGIGRKAGVKAKALRKLAPHMKTAAVWTAASLMGSGLARVFEAKDEGNVKGTIKELGFTAASAAAIYGSGDFAIRAKAGRALARILSKGKIK